MKKKSEALLEGGIDERYSVTLIRKREVIEGGFGRIAIGNSVQRKSVGQGLYEHHVLEPGGGKNDWDVWSIVVLIRVGFRN